MKHKDSKIRLGRLLRRPLPLAVAAGLAGLGAIHSTPALAFGFDLFKGDLEVKIDTTLSYGLSLRTENPDEDLIAKSFFDPLISTRPLAEQIAAPGAFSANGDDGNLNFPDKWDIISNTTKVLSEIDVRYKNFGAFTRLSWFNDFAVQGEERLTKTAKFLAGERFQLLDAYLWGNFNIGEEMAASLRVGRQVVSWGESTFIQNGINVINPVDVAKLRVAGAELREAFLPQNMLWGSLTFNENLSLESVLIFEFEQIDPEPAGTFFSTNDFATPGGQFAMLSFGLVPQPVTNQDLFNEVCRSGVRLAPGCAAALPRGLDRPPEDDPDQFGFALRYFSPELNDTEFGLYYLNYHSRLPVLSGTAVTSTDPTTGSVFVEYPKNIDLIGASFNTTIFNQTISWAGEVSYRPDMPFQLDDVELLFAGLSPLNAFIPEEVNRFRSQLGEFAPGAEIRGFERLDVTQFQTTFTSLIGASNPLDADQIAIVGEIGATKVWSFPDKDVLRFDGPGTSTGGGPDALSGALRNPLTQEKGFPNSFSWGYRLLVRADYNSAFGTAVTISPQVAFNHDVDGTTPGPGGNFIENRKSVTTTLGFNYLNTWTGEISYTTFFGAGNFNLLNDRDFVSFVARYNF